MHSRPEEHEPNKGQVSELHHDRNSRETPSESPNVAAALVSLVGLNVVKLC